MANKPVTVGRGQNYIAVSWREVEDLRGTCVLQGLDELKEWRVLYWGEREQVKIKKLAPCTCYHFRIRRQEVGEEGADKGWITFKGATLEEPYSVMHMTRAVKFGKTPLIRKIAHSKPLLLEVENKEMKTPLVQAIEKNDIQLVNLLITLGANVNTCSLYSKRSPLMSAVILGHVAIANLLVDKGSNVAATDVNNLGILHYSVDSNNVESVKFALKHSSCVDPQDSNGWTPLLRAAILNSKPEIVDLLLESGASSTTKDRNGFDFEKHKRLASKLS